jgi:uncharacterized protein YecE (DUF72 family)
MDIWIGTSGYSYPDWVGDFYPPGTKPGGMLPYYCRLFPLVELNFTFYRPPTAGMLERVADKTPPDFRFLVKVPQTISHEHSRRDLPGFCKAAEALLRRSQLAGVLCQLPQREHDTPQARKWLEALATELAGLGPAVEFRHRSWAKPETPAWCGEHGLELVAVDAPDLPGLYPSGWVQSGPRAYVRFHSRDAGKWYAGEKERYDYDYSDAELNEWIGEMRAAAAGTERTMLLFNNCHRSHAARNAQRLRTLVAEEAPQFHVVPPPEETEPAQRSLF